MSWMSVGQSWVLLGLWATVQLAMGEDPDRRVWNVDGVQREALVAKTVAKPTKESIKVPVVFVFHGHGGTMQRMARRNFHGLWPEAIVVYAQGLKTPTLRDPEGKRSGWQNRTGLQGDRDLKFFDAMLKTLIDHDSGDPKRVYATGHSNGGGMTYLLWSARRDKFAAVAVSAGGGASTWSIQPLPAMHLAGREDPIVPFTSQQRTMKRIREVNGVTDKSVDLPGVGLQWESQYGTPVVIHIHEGRHEFLKDAPARITRFFKRHTRPENGYPAGDPQVNTKKAANRFAEFDANGDGRLSRRELPRPALFRRLDSNADGIVTREETEAVFGPH